MVMPITILLAWHSGHSHLQATFEHGIGKLRAGDKLWDFHVPSALAVAAEPSA